MIQFVVDPAAPGVVVFSYPRYCRYRAMVRRLDGIAEHWLHDPLVAALGGYSAPTKNTRILYCRVRNCRLLYSFTNYKISHYLFKFL